MAGVGHDISHLRPSGTTVTNSAGTSTGIVSFMPRFSNSTREVAQDGRRGALMLTMDINHPDIEQFITSKDDLTKITGANISVKITDEFMRAVENDEDYELYFETKWENGNWKSFSKTVKAKSVWNKLIHQATKTAEPKLYTGFYKIYLLLGNLNFIKHGYQQGNKIIIL